MTIPFLDLFKKLTGRFCGDNATVEEAPAQPSRVVRPKKPEAERLSKTVMPNSIRSSSAPDPFRSAASTATPPRSNAPFELGARKITTAPNKTRPSQLPPALARALEPKIERTVSLRVSDLIDTVPAGFIKPVEILDTKAIVSLKASELEKGMPDKHPTISLTSLYQQVPEIFLRSVRPDDETRVELPYEKVLEQFQGAQVRADQERDPALPHVDTPILKATIEDSARFGTKIDPIETSTEPGVSVRHATAKSIAEAEPDATPAKSAPTKKPAPSGHQVISLYSPELRPKGKSPEPDPTETKIPFELSPNGTGVSASERVPASSGPPVPTPLPFNPALAKIAFELPKETPEATKPAEKPTAPAAAAEASPKPVPKTPTEEPFKLRLQEQGEKLVAKTSPTATETEKPVIASASAKTPTEESLKLRLQEGGEKPAAKMSPATETEKPPASKPTKPPTEGPFKLRLQEDVETVVGKTSTTVKETEKPALSPTPAKTSGSIPSTAAPSPTTESPAQARTISFSLKTVFQNLPAFQLTGDATKIPDDVRITFPLAFVEKQLASGRVSIAPEVFKAALPEEHRGLFQVDVGKTPVGLPLEEVLKNLPAAVLKLRDDQETVALDKDFETPFSLKAQEDARRFAPKPDEKISKETAKQSRAESKPGVAPVAEKIDPKKIVNQANALTGVRACAITFSDGLSLTGELPDDVEADGLCAMAPSMLERIEQHVNETKLGQLVAMTLHASDSAVTFFARGNLCLTALHDQPLAPEVRSRLADLIEKLSKTYAQPETPNVDH